LAVAIARINQANRPFVTPAGAAVAAANGGQAALIRDIDGRPVELLQRAPAQDSPASAASNIVDIGLAITVNDMDRTMRVYRDVLGFAVSSEIADDASIRALTGLSKATVRHNRVQAPGSSLSIELL